VPLKFDAARIVARTQGREGWVREGRRQLEQHRWRLPDPICRSRHERLLLAAERLEGEVTSIAAGDFVETSVPGVDVRAVPAYNTSKRDGEGRPFHPREAGYVGYELNVRGERLYHAGDTDVIPEMDQVAGVDVALLPVCGTYVMTAGEAAEAARRIQPRLAIPMHWGEHLGTRDDAVAFLRQAPVEAMIMDKTEV